MTLVINGTGRPAHKGDVRARAGGSAKPRNGRLRARLEHLGRHRRPNVSVLPPFGTNAPHADAGSLKWEHHSH
jgi:hypothetical protein